MADDVILAQAEMTYDDAGNTIQTVSRQRYHDAPDTETGALQDPETAPRARVTYSAAWQDALGRTVATADYGTNGEVAFVRPETIPEASDTVLVSRAAFDAAGNPYETISPAGQVNRSEFDDAGREATRIENYQPNSSSSSSTSDNDCTPSDDVNRTTRFTYTPDGLQATLTAVNSRTGNQTTTWTYGTTLIESDIQSTLLLRSVTYPDSTGASDVVSYTSNRQGDRTSLTDQRGCIHLYEYDKLGRPLHDRVTALGTGVDDTVRRLSVEYNVQGMRTHLTSWSAASGGDVVNQVHWTYNGFRQTLQSFQAHAGAVNTSTTVRVGMQYANGADNTIRLQGIVYPNGRDLAYNYGTPGGMADALSRVASLIDADTTHLADYSYLGLGAVVQQDSPQAKLRYTLVSLAGGTDPDTGDIYSGLDRFGRVKDVRWRNTELNTDLSRIQYGYNRASSRIWRANPTDPERRYDWIYGYDGLQRLKDAKRGTLNETQTAITDPQFGQCWTLDPTGNWRGFRQDDTGSGDWSLIQQRAANPVNEITNISATTGPVWATPTYDSAGNMTRIPKPAETGLSWSTLTEEQWSNLTPEEWSNLPLSPEGGSLTATYDAWNRLMNLTDTATGQTIQQNQYDARNFRTIRKDFADGELSEERHFYYTDDWRCVEERLGSDPDAADPDRQFVWGVRYIDDLVCRDRTTEATLYERLYGCQDGNWNMTAVVDTDGAVRERYEYDPYGNTTSLTAEFVPSTEEFDWETTYCGYRFDRTTRQHAIRNRYYIPSLGAFGTRDPIGYGTSASLSTYSSAPTQAVDPFGLFEWPVFYTIPGKGKPGRWASWGFYGVEDDSPADAGFTSFRDSLVQPVETTAKSVQVIAQSDTAQGVLRVANTVGVFVFFIESGPLILVPIGIWSADQVMAGMEQLILQHSTNSRGYSLAIYAIGDNPAGHLAGGLWDMSGDVACGAFAFSGAMRGGRSALQCPPKTVYCSQENIDQIWKSQRVYGNTEGSVYGMTLDNAPRWRTWTNRRTVDPGVVVFEGDAAALFGPHEIAGPFSGLKRYLGQHKAGFGDIVIDNSFRVGNRIYVTNAHLGTHFSQSAGRAWRRLFTRRIVDVSLDAAVLSLDDIKRIEGSITVDVTGTRGQRD